jgi:hypothetical protein
MMAEAGVVVPLVVAEAVRDVAVAPAEVELAFEVEIVALVDESRIRTRW